MIGWLLCLFGRHDRTELALFSYRYEMCVRCSSTRPVNPLLRRDSW